MKNLVRFVCCAFLLISFSCLSFAGDKETTLPPLSIKVTGAGEISLPVNYVVICLSIHVKDPENQLNTKLQSDNDVKKIIAIAKSFKIEETDLDASQISLGIDYNYDKNDNEIFNGYYSDRGVKLTLRDLDKLDALLTKVFEIKSVGLKSLSFESEKNYSELREPLLKKAIANAKKEALMMAQLLDLQLGRILSVNRGVDYSGEVFFDAEESLDVSVAEIKSSFLKKTVTYSESISLTYELKEK